MPKRRRRHRPIPTPGPLMEVQDAQSTEPLTFPFRMAGLGVSAFEILAALRAHGIDADKVRLRGGDWPGQLGFDVLRGGREVFHGALLLDLRVSDPRASVVAKLTLEPATEP